MTRSISNMVSTVKNWWTFLVSGIILIIAAIAVLVYPTESYQIIGWIFAIGLLASGITYTVASIKNRAILKNWGLYLVGGIAEAAIGIYMIINPIVSLAVLPIYVGISLLMIGVKTGATSIDLKNYGMPDWGWGLAYGIALAAIGSLMVIFPAYGAANIVVLSSFALLIAGISQISLSIKLKEIKSVTIDVYKDLKKNIKRTLSESLKELQKEVENTVEEVVSESEEYNPQTS